MNTNTANPNSTTIQQRALGGPGTPETHAEPEDTNQVVNTDGPGKNNAPHLFPTLQITCPQDGARGQNPVPLQATAWHAADGDLGHAIQWSSDIDGPLGVGPNLRLGLTEAQHVITAEVTGMTGFTQQTSVVIMLCRGAEPMNWVGDNGEGGDDGGEGGV